MLSTTFMCVSINTILCMCFLYFCYYLPYSKDLSWWNTYYFLFKCFIKELKLLLIFYAHLAGFLSLLYFLKKQKRHVNSLCCTFIFLFETVDKLFLKLYMNILALEATLFFWRGGLRNSCVKQLLTSIVPVCLSTWNNWTSTGWIFMKFYSDRIHLWLISARNNRHSSQCHTQIHGF
jgi:hypothetical protein